jgi:hypothetical protein
MFEKQTLKEGLLKIWIYRIIFRFDFRMEEDDNSVWTFHYEQKKFKEDGIWRPEGILRTVFFYKHRHLVPEHKDADYL